MGGLNEMDECMGRWVNEEEEEEDSFIHGYVGGWVGRTLFTPAKRSRKKTWSSSGRVKALEEVGDKEEEEKEEEDAFIHGWAGGWVGGWVGGTYSVDSC